MRKCLENVKKMVILRQQRYTWQHNLNEALPTHAK